MNPDCIFCKIIAGALPSNKVYEDDQVIAFHDISPKARIHILVVPRRHIPSISDTDSDYDLLLGHMVSVAAQVARDHNLKGYKLLFNVNKEGGQVVFHVHLHLLGGERIKLNEC